MSIGMDLGFAAVNSFAGRCTGGSVTAQEAGRTEGAPASSAGYDTFYYDQPYAVQLGESGGGILSKCAGKAAKAAKFGAKVVGWMGRELYNTRPAKSIRRTVSYYCQERPYAGRPLKDWCKIATIYTASIMIGATAGCGVAGIAGLIGSGGNVPITFCAATAGTFLGAGVGALDAKRNVSVKESLGEIGKPISFEKFVEGYLLKRKSLAAQDQGEMVQKTKQKLDKASQKHKVKLEHKLQERLKEQELKLVSLQAEVERLLRQRQG
ncbi:hypothetical protein EOPP23_11405 [Endozoicomonas sp. OPT23]|uniref:hypothetical protein n=1 Tax=Endozoicomonas sp. OPT23 TaxID=2072845 RepID=UPI00129AFF0E|nr:hypothetical protein [Endozoicomonas sp. OPT23]MRI33593.1 hypothetical protein [Endozoicomonas sp. OPT23]